MRRFLLSVLYFCFLLGVTNVRAESFARGLLWEISRSGTASSYLFGTMHTADQRLLVLNPAVEAAFAQARSFALEMYPNEMVARRFAEASELPAAQSLSMMMPASDFIQLREVLAVRGIEARQVERFKPWAALLLLTEAGAEAGPDLAPVSSHSLDIELYVRARAARKTVEDLDHIDEQIEVFDSLPATTQLALLSLALNRLSLLAIEQEQRMAAYQRGDLRRLMDLAREFPGVTAEMREHLAVLERKLIRDRSVVMAYRLQTLLRRGSTFAAVGALHLYGEHGMLQLLHDDGWTVRRRD